jgi:dihydroorotate dehydrogenase (fumarate)
MEDPTMAKLTSTYMGLALEHPVMASASPISYTLDGIRRLEDGGVSGIVLFSLFEEHIRALEGKREWMAGGWAERVVDATGYLPLPRRRDVRPEAYLELIRRAKEAVDIPIIGSLNGVTDEGWTRYAGLIQEAGADALELNVFYVPADPAVHGRAVEQRYVDVTAEVRRAVTIPLAVKMHPFFSAIAEVSRRLLVAGADGLVLFNRLYQPDFDLDRLEVATDVNLSAPDEIRLPLLWISVLHGRLPVSLAAATGVDSYREVAKYILAGADTVMATSTLLRNGPEHAKSLVQGLADWMDRRNFASLHEMKGHMSQLRVSDPEAFERSNYIRILQAYAAS